MKGNTLTYTGTIGTSRASFLTKASLSNDKPIASISVIHNGAAQIIGVWWGSDPGVDTPLTYMAVFGADYRRDCAPLNIKNPVNRLSTLYFVSDTAGTPFTAIVELA